MLYFNQHPNRHGLRSTNNLNSEESSMKLNRWLTRIIPTVGIALSLFLTPLPAKANIQKKWQNTNSGINELDIKFVLTHPNIANIVYAGTENAVYKTIDNGNTWKWLFNTSGSEKEVNYIWISPKRENYIYVATENGLYLSTNGGKGWEVLYKGKSQDTRNCLCVTSVGEKIFVGTKSGLFISTDNGRTWHKEKGRLGEIEITSIAANPSNSENIFLATQGGVYRKQNEINSWEKVYAFTKAQFFSEDDSESDESQSQKANHITTDSKDPYSVFLATNSGIISSKNAGTNWSKFNHKGLLTQSIRFLLADTKEPILYAATDRGIFEYKENKWEEIYKGILTKDIHNLSLDIRGNLWVATSQGVFKTSSLRNRSISQQLASNYLNNEPAIADIQKAVIKYADVIRPERLNGHRRSIALSALFPSATFKLDVERDHWEGGSTSTSIPSGDDFLWRGVDAAEWYISASWDLGDLIWDDQQRQIDNQQRYMIELRDDLLDKVTRYYFERKRLRQEILNNSTEDQIELNEKKLRLEELTAYIDALTGGYLSRHINQ